MRVNRFVLFLVATMFIVGLSLSAVYAQDATATPAGGDAQPTQTGDTNNQGQNQQGQTGQQNQNQQGQNQQGQTGQTGQSFQQGTVACDTDLMLDLYMAEKFFGFSSFVNQMTADDIGFNMNTFDRGQFGMLFDNNQNQTATGANQQLQMSAELRNHMTELMAMSDAEFDTWMRDDMTAELTEMGADTSTMTMLQNAQPMAGEASECMALRRTLRRFFIGLVFGEAQFGNMTSTNMGTGTQQGTTSNQQNQQGTTGTQQGNTGTQQGSTNQQNDTAGIAPGAITINLAGQEGVSDADATGTAVVYLRTDSNEICVDVSMQNMTQPSTLAIHRGGVNEAGQVVLPLNAPNEQGLSSTCQTVDPALMQEMMNNLGNFSIQAFNSEFPSGAARGQFGTTQSSQTGDQSGDDSGDNSGSDGSGD